MMPSSKGRSCARLPRKARRGRFEASLQQRLRMASRRAFVSSVMGASAVLPSFRPDAIRKVLDAAGRSSGAPDDEAYWGEIQRAFDSDRTMVNLNNGGVCP